jgi:ABC-type glycerol-3-phosphate transport system substrate-binding protein
MIDLPDYKNMRRKYQMKKRMLWSLLSLLVIVSTLAVACGPKPTEAPPEPTEAPSLPEPVTVEVWFHSGKGEEREVLDAQVQDFNAMQDDVIMLRSKTLTLCRMM